MSAGPAKPRSMRGIAMFLVAMSLTCGAACKRADASAAFDGTWAVEIVCPKTAEGALALDDKLTAIVSGGTLHGERLTRGTPGWLSIDGSIADDGTAVLSARGLLDAHAYGPSTTSTFTPTPFYYHVKALFDAKHGTGTRTEIRPCALTFDRAP